MQLRDVPDWAYLLQEFDSLYRQSSSGGSKAIRSHRKRVREALSAVIDSNPELIDRQPEQKPVTAHLGRVFEIAARAGVSRLSRTLERVSHLLTWEYGYQSVPKALAQKYAYCEILGPIGPIRSERLILGFVLFAPNTVYPRHSHHEIEESYISVAGAWSENEMAVYAPGSMVLNMPGHEHRITTGEHDPCLLAYAWIGPDERLAQPGMKFSKVRKRLEQGI
ncbi:dimethylsulfonioproprionate lyase family protein [Rhizobium sp. PAMB 3182]